MPRGNVMEALISVVPYLMGISVVAVVIAFFFLQSRARGLARVCIVAGALLTLFSPIFLKATVRSHEIVYILIVYVSVNTGVIMASVGVILFSISLPSRRLDLKPDDERPLSSQIIKETFENGQ